MADNTPNTPKKSRQPAKPVVTRIRPLGGKRLPEPFVRVNDELLPPQLESRGLDPLKRTRGMTDRAAAAAGLELPKE